MIWYRFINQRTQHVYAFIITRILNHDLYLMLSCVLLAESRNKLVICSNLLYRRKVTIL